MRRPFALMTAVAVTAGGLTLMPPASPATIEAGSLAARPSNIQRTEVCFTVENLGDPDSQQVSGTLFHRENSPGGGTALLLQHGSVSERSVWDGGRPTLTGVPSMAEQLAGAGYDVFAIDRLGYGRSPYRPGEEGTGWTLTMDSYVEMTHEMVDQIRSGTYRITTDTCPGGATAGRPAAKVVLMGQSGGATLTEGYATRYHDIDGIVPMVMSNFGCSDRCFQELIVDTATPQWADPRNDYIYLFWGPGGTPTYSQTCEDFLFYTEGASEDVLANVCGPGYFGGTEPRLMPSGDLSTAITMQQEIASGAVSLVGPTPALLVFADKDTIYPPAGLSKDRLDQPEDKITPEMEYWTTNPGCNCDVEFLWQRNAGHQLFFHDSVTEMIADVIEWLRSRGL